MFLTCFVLLISFDCDNGGSTEILNVDVISFWQTSRTNRATGVQAALLARLIQHAFYKVSLPSRYQGLYSFL